ncbi:LEA type 2 family protein [Candidatus Poribacteria bacterium]
MTLKQIVKTNFGVVLCLLLVTVFLSSCAVLNELAGEANIRRPQVNFSGAKITGLSFDTAELLFDLKIQNPNSVGLTMAGFNYDFLINNGSFLKGKQDKGLEIAAGGESAVQVPLSLRYVDLYQTFQSLKNQDLSNYQINFGFAFDVPVLGRVNIPVSKSGDFPLLKLPKVSVNSLKLKGLALTGADLVLRVQLDNPNAFSMLLEKLQYQFAVDGQNWISGFAEEPTQITEKGQGFVDIPISLNLLQMGQSVRQLLSGDKDLNYSLGGNLDLATSLPLLGKINLPFDRAGSVKLIR